MPTPSPGHIIISRSDNIGDVVLTLPLASALKAAWPQCRISVLARAYVRDVVDAHPAVDGFIDWAELDQMSTPEAVTALTQTKADMILHVFPKRKIAQLAKAAGIPRRIGTNRRWYHWLYCNQRVNFSRKKSKLHEAQLNMRLLQALDLCYTYTLPELIPMLQLEPQPLTPKLQQLIDPKRFTLILHPLSHGHGREWPLSHFAQLSRALDHARFQILITGSAAEGERLQNSELLQIEQVNSLCGKLSLSELLSLIKSADGLVASGTGPLHLAAACGIHTLGLFPKKAGIDAKRWGPVGERAQALTCIEPCPGCSSSVDCACMRMLQVRQVLQPTQSWPQQTANKNQTPKANLQAQIEPDQVIPYFICNLPNSYKRREFQKNQSRKLGLALHVIPAIDNQSARLKDYKNSWEHSVVCGEDALLLSFLDTIEAALDSQAPLVLLAEDDTIFCDNFREELSKTISELPEDWEVFHLGSNFIENFSTSRIFKSWPQKDGQPIAAGQPVCLLANRASLQRLHRAYKNYITQCKWQGLDIILTEIYLSKAVTSYMASNPQLCLHKFENFGSDISKNNQHLKKYSKLWRWQRKTGYKKCIADYIARNHKSANIFKKYTTKIMMKILQVKVG